MCGTKSKSRTDKLINADCCTRASGYFKLLEICNVLVTPFFAIGLAMCTTGTDWQVNICKLSRYFNIGMGKKFELGKTKVPQMFINCGKALLLAPSEDKLWIFMNELLSQKLNG